MILWLTKERRNTMSDKKRQPLGIELVKRGIVTEELSKNTTRKENWRYIKYSKSM